MEEYERFHITDVNIEDECRSSCGLDVSVYVDTLEKVNIHLGESMTIRTDEQGCAVLRHILHDAEEKLESVRYRKVNEALDRLTEEMNPQSGNRSEGGMNEAQGVDVFDMNLANDPVRW